MRRFVLPVAALALAAAAPVCAQTPAPTASATPVAGPAAAPADVASVDAIVAALYDVISGEADQARDWDRFRSLFLPGAVMTSTGRGPDNALRARAVSPDDYIARNSPHFAAQPFYEREVGRAVDRFGPLVTVRSAYAIRSARDAAEPTQRGLNVIQLFDDGARLWIVSVTWAVETPDRPLPADLAAVP